MTRRTRGLYGLLALGLVVGWITSAAGQAISCGDTLGPGGMFILPADLACGTVSPALTVRDGAQLDLGGHTISTAAGRVVILLEGQRAVVHNGIVEGLGLSSGIHVAGDGGHTVHHVSVFATEFGVIVTSDNNRLINNTATVKVDFVFSIGGNQNLLDSNWGEGGQLGFGIGGDQNLLVENTYESPGLTGFAIGGNQNLLIRNNVTEALQTSFEISGDGNRLVGNLALNSRFLGGIVVSGQETVIVRNTALNNGRDLVDKHEDCDNNLWQQNVFRTSRSGTTENPACIQ